MSLVDIVQQGWEAVGRGDFDTLVEDYVENMVFIMPGQSDILEGRQAFRVALDGLGEILPLDSKSQGCAKSKGKMRSFQFLNGNLKRLRILNYPFYSSLTAIRSMRKGGSLTLSNGRVLFKAEFFSNFDDQ